LGQPSDTKPTVGTCPRFFSSEPVFCRVAVIARL
jgi:hypothetical protein